jgi:hypothetical protein
VATTGFTKNFVVKNGITTGPITLDANSGNITGTNLSVTGLSEFGNIGNVKITGGTSGQAIVTDGAGNLSFANASAASNPAPMPTYVAVGDDLVISANYQGLFGYPITIDGTMTVDGILIDVNDNGNGGGGGGTATGLNADIANVSISGGSPGYYLQTNGSGTLTWATGGGGGSGSPGGSNTQIQFNDAGSFGGNTGFTFNKITGIFTSPYLAGNGNGLSNIQGANVSGAVGLATYAGTANAVAGANVSGAVTYATTANAVAGANVSGTVSSATTATTAGTVTTAAQPNITSVGTLTSLTINGNISANNANITGNIVPTSNNTYSLGSASSYWKDAFIGPGSLYINGVKVLEESSNAIVISADTNQTVRVTSAGSGDVQLQTTGSGVIAVKGPLQIQAGDNITSSNGGPIGFTNPINVDTLSSLSANTNLTISANGTGNIQLNDDVTISGNLTINGGGGNLSVTSLTVEDNIIDISAETTGTPVNNAGIRVIRGDDPSVQTRWNETSETWQITNDGSTYLNVVGSNTTTGNISVGNISAALGDFTTVTGSLTTASQPNITTIGTQTTLSATGNITGGNVVTAGTGNVGTLYVGSGGANINGYTKITGNIDVTGNFNVTGNLNYQNVTDLVVGDPLIYLAANNVGDTDDIGIVGNYNDGTYQHTGVARDHTDGTWKFFSGVTNEPTTSIDWANAQYPSVKTGNLFSANITGTGWANITGNVTAGNANLGNAVTANYFIGSGANLTSIAGANVTGQVDYAATANSVAGGNVSGQVSYAAVANSVAGANVTGAVSYATTANAVAGANVSGEVSFAATANSVALANVSGAGNIASINLNGNTSQILYGNGVFASAPVSYGNSNVATFLASYGSNTITTTGNVSAGNVTSSGQITANVSAGLNFLAEKSGGGSFQLNVGGNAGAQLDTLSGGGLRIYTANGNGGSLSNTAYFSSTGAFTATGNITGGNLTTAGTLSAATVTETSSIALKENFRPIENPLEKVLQLLGQIYDRKDGSSKDEAGLVAEDVYKIIPNLVKTDSNGNPESVFYSRLSVYLLESIKVLNDEIAELKGKKRKSKK